jgi:hypothetical protein
MITNVHPPPTHKNHLNVTLHLLDLKKKKRFPTTILRSFFSLPIFSILERDGKSFRLVIIIQKILVISEHQFLFVSADRGSRDIRNVGTFLLTTRRQNPDWHRLRDNYLITRHKNAVVEILDLKEIRLFSQQYERPIFCYDRGLGWRSG